MNMKIKLISRFSALFLGLIFASCESQQKDDSSTSSNMQQQEAPGIAEKFQGIYHGVQPAYNLKNENGDEMIINGNPVAVPSIDYKFTIKEDFDVSLQQISLEDNSPVNYNGKSKVLSENDKVIVVSCELSDGKSSNPTYILTIEKAKLNGTCASGNEPAFFVEKVKN